MQLLLKKSQLLWELLTLSEVCILHSADCELYCSVIWPDCFFGEPYIWAAWVFSFGHWLGVLLCLAGKCRPICFYSGSREKRMRVISAPGYWIPAGYCLMVLNLITVLRSLFPCCGTGNLDTALLRILWWQDFDFESASGRFRRQKRRRSHRCYCSYGTWQTVVGSWGPCAVPCASWFPEHGWWFLWPWLSQLFSRFCKTLIPCINSLPAWKHLE